MKPLKFGLLSLVPLLFLICLTNIHAQPPNKYQQLKSELKVDDKLTYNEVIQNPGLYKDKVIELKGRLVGQLVAADKVLLAIDLADSDTLFISAPGEVTKLYLGNNVRIFARVVKHEEAFSNSPDLEIAGILLEMEVPKPKPKPPEAQPTPAAPSPAMVSFPSRSMTTPRPYPTANYTETIDMQKIIEAYKKAVAYFNPRLNPETVDKIARLVLHYSDVFDIDARLVMAVIAVESGFNPHARSYKGAMGLGQLMPGTARGLGVTNAYNVHENIYGAVRLIKGHLDKFKNYPLWERLALALACYNAGSGAVAKYKGIPPYRETINYIKRVAELYSYWCKGK